MATVRPIAQLGRPVLRQVAHRIDDPFAPEVQALIDDMLATMMAAEGVGIAAPQLFVPLSLIIVASRPNSRYPHAPEMAPIVMLNPELIWFTRETDDGYEGCLSIPGLRGPVARHRRIGIRYLTRAGELREEEYEGFPSRVFQHEFDHVQGIVFIDRVTDTRRLMTEKEYFRSLSEQG